LGLVRDHKLIVTENLGLEHDGAPKARRRIPVPYSRRHAGLVPAGHQAEEAGCELVIQDARKERPARTCPCRRAVRKRALSKATTDVVRVRGKWREWAHQVMETA